MTERQRLSNRRASDVMSAARTFSSSQPADQNPPILKMFEREDWTLFRTVEGLQQRAGVSAERLRRLVLKELADNGLDTGGSITVDQIETTGVYRARAVASNKALVYEIAQLQHRPTALKVARLGSVDRAENSEESRAPSSKRPTIPTRPVRKSRSVCRNAP